MTEANIIGILLVGAMLLLIYAGMYVAVALCVLSFIGVWLIRGDAGIAVNLLALAANDAISDYVFGVVPLFVLMGLLVAVADIGKDTFEVANQLLRRVRGGLGVATVAANAVFAAITGISIASAAVFTKVAVPEMLRHGFSPSFSVGVVAGSSVLGMLLPPSLLLILFGVLTEQSIGDLFIAGIIPGLLLALAFAVGIIIMATVRPAWVYVNPAIEHTGEEKPHMGMLEIAGKMFPIVLLIALVLGGIYGGLFTPVEAGAVGAAGSMLGSGAVVVMDSTTDAVKACWRVVRFFARESCGKCTPCREGTSWLEKVLRRILDGQGRPDDIGLLLDVSDNISPGIAWPPKQTTICPLGPSAVSPIASAIVRFKDEFIAYCGGTGESPVAINGKAYIAKPSEVAGV